MQVHRLILATAIMLWGPSIASTQELRNDAGVSVPPVMRFEATLDENGKIKIVPATIEKQKAMDPMDSASGKNDALARAAAEIMGKNQLVQQLSQQDVWYLRDSKGNVDNLVVLPRGLNPDKQIVAMVPAGGDLKRVSSDALLTSWMPDTNGMGEILTQLLEGAQDAVCKLKARPTQFGTEVDISAGLGVTGRVALNASWETEKLCANVSETPK